MIRTLRTKGLTERHWRDIGEKLELNYELNSKTLNLFKIIQLDMYTEESMRIIKGISETATKEYAVQLALDSLDKDMKLCEFEFDLAPDRVNKVVKRLHEVNLTFDEFYLRVSVLKTNPHMKSFYDKLVEIEKNIKSVLEIVAEWALFQRNWIFMQGIFNKPEISKQLPQETKLFYGIDSNYKVTIKHFTQVPQIYRVHYKEQQLTSLQKSNQDCEFIRQGLQRFLEVKRDFFPRMFFLSNEEMIEIFGKGDQLIESLIKEQTSAFVTHLFEGIDKFIFNSDK